MALVKIRNLEYLRKKDVKLYEAIQDIQRFLPPAEQEPPPNVGNLSVLPLGNGAVDVTFADSGTVNQGVNYFVEHADNPDFRNARVEHFGASRNGTIVIGSGSRYFRVFSQYQNPHSLPSPPVIFGGPQGPFRVFGGGTPTPTLQPSTGSGTSSANGQQIGSGFGKIRIRTSTKVRTATA